MKPRILFLAPKAPYPLTSGAAMRQFHLARAYSTLASVELAFFFNMVELAFFFNMRENLVSEVRTGLALYCERFHPIPAPPARRPGQLGPWRAFGRMMTRPVLANVELRQLIAASAASTRSRL